MTGAAAVVGGCLGRGDEDRRSNRDGDSDAAEPSEREDDETGRDGGELDLREANVVGVSFNGEDGAYTFDVTLYHDDAGEEGYADLWVVESLNGDEVGRRNLAHPHGTRRFTRSATVSTDEDCVVVRGRDQTHGYGGRAVVVNLETGEKRGFAQGREPSSFNESDCP